MICPTGGAKYFCAEDWTVDSALIELVKFDFWRNVRAGLSSFVTRPVAINRDSSLSRARLGPDRDRVLKPSNPLWGLRNQGLKRCVGAAEFAPGALDETIACNQFAVEAAGQSL